MRNGHLLYSGPVEAVRRVMPYTPNVWWPSNRAWVVARAIEDDSTFVAGNRELIEALGRGPWSGGK